MRMNFSGNGKSETAKSLLLCKTVFRAPFWLYKFCGVYVRYGLYDRKSVYNLKRCAVRVA